MKSGKEETIDTDAGIVAAARKFRDRRALRTVIDVGTGSGCIGITLKLALPDIHVIATDISRDALNVAEKNAKRLGAEISFRSGSLLAPLADLTEPFLVVSNPPYIPQSRKLDADVAEFEPASALYGGPNGDETIRTLMDQCAKHPHCAGIALECEKNQLFEPGKG